MDLFAVLSNVQAEHRLQAVKMGNVMKLFISAHSVIFTVAQKRIRGNFFFDNNSNNYVRLQYLCQDLFLGMLNDHQKSVSFPTSVVFSVVVFKLLSKRKQNVFETQCIQVYAVCF